MSKMNLIFAALTVTAFAVSSCHKKECGRNERKKDCICTMEYDPVCGSDGKTYGNPCSAECEGVKNYTPGECAVR